MFGDTVPSRGGYQGERMQTRNRLETWMLENDGVGGRQKFMMGNKRQEEEQDHAGF